MDISLDISLWEKFAKCWQPVAPAVEGRGSEMYVDIGVEENNPIMDEKFDIDDELDTFFGR